MTSLTTSPVELVGWTTVSVLVLILVRQARLMRAFVRPARDDLSSWPHVSVILFADEPDGWVRKTIAEIDASDYPGELEILIAVEREDRITAMRTLPLASSRTRVVLVPRDPERMRLCLTDEARGEWMILMCSESNMEPEAITRFVSEASRSDAGVLSFLPRMEIRGNDLLTEPMIPWLELTFHGGPSSRLRRSSCVPLVLRRETFRARGDRVAARTLDGFGLISRPASLAHAHALAETVDGARARRVTIAVLLPLLFTVPPVLAILLGSFPWIVAAVLSFWIRFRVAARTGEPIPGAFLHPFAVLLASWTLATSRPSDGNETSVRC